MDLSAWWEAAAGSRLWARPMEALAGVAWCGFRPKSGVSDGFASEVGTLPSSQSSDLRSSVAINDKHKHLHWRPGPTFFLYLCIMGWGEPGVGQGWGM